MTKYDNAKIICLNRLPIEDDVGIVPFFISQLSANHISSYRNCKEMFIPSAYVSELFALSGIDNLSSLSVENGNERYQCIENCMISSGNSIITGCENCFHGNASSIGKYSLYHRNNLKSAVISDMQNLSVIDQHAFDGCNNLKSFFANASASQLTLNDYAVCNCSALTDIRLSAENGSLILNSNSICNCQNIQHLTVRNAKNIPNSFLKNQQSLKQLHIQTSAPSAKFNCLDDSFRSCTQLSSITCDFQTPPLLGSNAFYCAGYNTKSLSVNVLSVPYGCFGNYVSDLQWSKIIANGKYEVKDGQEHVFPDTDYTYVKYLDDTETKLYVKGTVSAEHFENKTQIKNITLGNAVSSIADSAFDGFQNLENITLSKHIVKLPQYAFRNCYNLKDIDLTHIQQIGYGAFYYCYGITELAIPKCTSSLNYYAFNDYDFGKWLSKMPNLSCLSFKRTYSNLSNIIESYSESMPLPYFGIDRSKVRCLELNLDLTRHSDRYFDALDFYSKNVPLEFEYARTNISQNGNINTFNVTAEYNDSIMTLNCVDTSLCMIDIGIGLSAILECHDNQYLNDLIFSKTNKTLCLKCNNSDSNFADNHLLKSFDFPDDISCESQLCSYGNCCFTFSNNYCMSSINVPSCLLNLGSGAFKNDYALSSIDLKNISCIGNHSKRTDIGEDDGFFNSCSSLNSVNAQNVLSIDDIKTFQGCTSLKTVDFSSLSVSQIYDCVCELSTFGDSYASDLSIAVVAKDRTVDFIYSKSKNKWHFKGHNTNLHLSEFSQKSEIQRFSEIGQVMTESEPLNLTNKVAVNNWLEFSPIEDESVSVSFSNSKASFVYSYDKINWIDDNGTSVKCIVNPSETLYLAAKPEQFEVGNSNIDAPTDGIFLDVKGKTKLAGNIAALINSVKEIHDLNTDISMAPGYSLENIRFDQKENERFSDIGIFGFTDIADASELKLELENLTEYCYYTLFCNCYHLSVAPALPAKHLSVACYAGMFENCISLTSSPELPALVVENGAYNAMFECCYNLKSAGNIYASIIDVDGCEVMFNQCSSLTSAPSFSATVLSDYSCDSMFWNCKSMSGDVSLSATTLGYECYAQMFAGTKISSIHTNMTSFNDADGRLATENWLAETDDEGEIVARTQPGKFYYTYSNLQIPSRNDSYVPNSWTIHKI